MSRSFQQFHTSLQNVLSLSLSAHDERRTPASLASALPHILTLLISLLARPLRVQTVSADDCLVQLVAKVRKCMSIWVTIPPQAP